MMEDFPNSFGFSVSHTTRAPRGQEVNGVTIRIYVYYAGRILFRYKGGDGEGYCRREVY